MGGGGLLPSYDYVVVGAGIVGLATAYHLKRLEPQASVSVVEAGPAPGSGDTGRSMAAFRAFFTSRLNMLLAGSSIEYYLSVERSGRSLGLRMAGYLFLADEAMLSALREGLREAERLGLEFESLEVSRLEGLLGLRARVSGSEEAELLGVGDVVEAILVRRAGFLAAERLADHYYREASRLGVAFSFNSRVESLILEPRVRLGIEGEPLPWQDPRVAGVRLSGGGEVRARRAVVVAAGAYAAEILNPAGFESFTRPKKRQVFRLQLRGETAGLLKAELVRGSGSPPLLILPRRLLVRPAVEEGSVWVQLSDEAGRPYGLEGWEPAAEEHYYTLAIHPLLSLYLPRLSGLAPSGAWAGYYDMSPDGLPVVQRYEEERLVVAGGTSGSGIMKGDAIGRVAAAAAAGLDEAELYGGEKVRVSWLGFRGRRCEEEKLIL